MISIIISSYRKKMYTALFQNIEETIGEIEFEVIRVYNPGKMGISEAYNQGAKDAKYDYLLFLHEDVKFLKKGWGEEFIKIFNFDNLGVFGLAGGLKKFALPSGHDQGIDKYRRVFVTQQDNENFKKDGIQEPIKTKTLDGVFLGLSKKRWEELKFNEKLKGFHFYDLDISLRSSLKYQNYIVSNIYLLHFSLGNFGDEWVKACIKFHKNAYNFDTANGKEVSQLRRFWYQRLLFERINFQNRLNYTLKLGIDKGSVRSAVHFLFQKKRLI